MAQFQIISGKVPASAFYDMLDEIYWNAPSVESNRERKVKTGATNRPKKVAKHAAK